MVPAVYRVSETDIVIIMLGVRFHLKQMGAHCWALVSSVTLHDFWMVFIGVNMPLHDVPE